MSKRNKDATSRILVEEARAKLTEAFGDSEIVQSLIETHVVPRSEDGSVDAVLIDQLISQGDLQIPSVPLPAQPEAKEDAKPKIGAKEVRLALQEMYDFYYVQGSGQSTRRANASEFFAVAKGQKDARPISITEGGGRFALHARSHIEVAMDGAASSGMLDNALKNLFAHLMTGVIEAKPVNISLRASAFSSSETGETERLVVDLAEDGLACVEVTKGGWRVLEGGAEGVLFRETESTFPLVRPSDTPSYDGLFEALDIDRDSQNGRLIRGWLACAFLNNMSRPMLLLNGPQGSGKSTRAGFIMACINPAAMEGGSYVIGSSMGKEGDDVVRAANNFLPGWDNVGKITEDNSEFVCRLVTGERMSKRALYTDGGVYSVSYMRTGIMTSISVPAFKPDAMARIIQIKLEKIREYREQGRLSAQLRSALPDIMAAIFDDVATIIRNQHLDFEDRVPPRMSSYWRNLMRLDPRLGEAYIEAELESIEDQAEGSRFIEVIAHAVDAHGGHLIANSVSELYTKLENEAWVLSDSHRRDFPKSQKACRDWIIKDLPLLHAVGLEYREKKVQGRRSYQLSRIKELPRESPPAGTSAAAAG